MNVKILLVDDHRMVRDGLRSLLESQPGIHVVAEASDVESALGHLERVVPDLALVDVVLDHSSGVDATRRILERCPSIKVIGMTGYHETHFLQEMLQAGASGFFLKTADFNEVLRAVEAVLDGRRYVSPDIVEAFVDELADGDSPLDSLSPRERQVLEGIAKGVSAKEMASELGVHRKTIEAQRRSLMRKLELRDVSQVVMFAIRHGIVPVEEPRRPAERRPG